MDTQTTVEQLKKSAVEFRDERNWLQFHDPKNLSIGLSVEAAELQELFLWKSETEVKDLLNSKKDKQKVQEELADICIFLLYLSEACAVDLSDAVKEKLEHNRQKYPVDQSYNSSKKYTEFGSHWG